MEKRQAAEADKLDMKHRVPSVTASPVKHRREESRFETKKSSQKAQPLTQAQKEEKMYELHTANGMFSCKCDICVNHINPWKNIRKYSADKIAAMPPIDTLK
jgi:hypothetical protein